MDQDTTDTTNMCQVCGDKAIGRNFGGITCNSCKNFFRRSINKKLNGQSKCVSQNRCAIDMQNRTHCKRCRLNKCLTIGMRKELVLNRKKLAGDGSLLSTAANEECQSVAESPDLQSIDPIVDHNVVAEELTDIESLSTVPLTEVWTVCPVVRPIPTFDKMFNDMELSRLNELSVAASLLPRASANGCCRLYRVTTKIDLHRECHNTLDERICSIIKFIKQLSLFNSICDYDKSALVKNSCYQIMLLKNLPWYDCDQQTWTWVINQEYSTQWNVNLWETNKHFLTSVPSEFIKDNHLLNLVAAIFLFQNDQVQLEHRRAIKLNQQMYFYLLQRYLIQKFRSDDKSFECLSQLMNLVYQLNHHFKTYMTSAKHHAHLFTPLARECFDFDILM